MHVYVWCVSCLVCLVDESETKLARRQHAYACMCHGFASIMHIKRADDDRYASSQSVVYNWRTLRCGDCMHAYHLVRLQSSSFHPWQIQLKFLFIWEKSKQIICCCDIAAKQLNKVLVDQLSHYTSGQEDTANSKGPAPSCSYNKKEEKSKLLAPECGMCLLFHSLIESIFSLYFC